MSLGQPLENQGLLLALLLLPEAHHQPTAHERVVGARGRTQTRGGNAVEFATLNVGDGEHVVSFRLVCCDGLNSALMTVDRQHRTNPENKKQQRQRELAKPLVFNDAYPRETREATLST